LLARFSKRDKIRCPRSLSRHVFSRMGPDLSSLTRKLNQRTLPGAAEGIAVDQHDRRDAASQLAGMTAARLSTARRSETQNQRIATPSGGNLARSLYQQI